MPIKGGYLLATGGGALLLWSGLKGKSWSQAFRAVISGRDPTATLTAYPISPGTPSTDGSGLGGGVPGSASQLAVDFEGYVGVVPYRWNKASPRTGWDCSGAFNYVANHDMHLSIPGYKPGTFTGASHGPNTFIYMGWLPLHAARVKSGQVEAGDVCLWQTHMGVAVDGTHYVSAFDTQKGTVVQPIHGGGPVGEIATFWRLR
jgi:cell wall-associated NlpC family hydrolase